MPRWLRKDFQPFLCLHTAGAPTLQTSVYDPSVHHSETPAPALASFSLAQCIASSVPKRPGRPPGFLAASILKACAKGGPARPGSEAARPAAKKKPAGPAGKACRPGVAGKSVSHHHRHSAWHRTERWRVYGDTGITEVDWAMGSIHLRDPRVDRAHLII